MPKLGSYRSHPVAEPLVIRPSPIAKSSPAVPSTAPFSPPSSSPRLNQAWLAILGLILLSALLLIAKAGRILNIAFPLGAFVVGLFLYRKYPLVYLGYSWWMIFLSPWVRRLADWRGSWTDPSPILLAPILVSLITVATLFQHFPKVYNRRGLPFTLCLVSISYSFLIGMTNRNPTNGTILDFLGWLTPILLGFHLYLNWQDYPQYRQNFQRTFLWGTLLIGGYGMIQYLVLPEWDKSWLQNVIDNKGIVSFGTPEPLEVRVFSTLNSPQALGGALMPGLILLFSNQGNLRFPALGLGYLSFLLSSARAAWLSWFTGLLIYLPVMKPHLQIRLIMSLCVAALFVVPLATIEPFATVISARLETLTGIQNDTSYNDRLSAYTGLVDQALVEFIGKGMGVDQSFGGEDNGLLTLIFTLGWLGTIPYLLGLGLMFWLLFKSTQLRRDSFASASLAIALGSFEQILSNVATTGIIGTVVWGFLGIAMAADKYHQHQKIQRLPP